ncbi:unnamed protein product [Toxocara canis]|uniref:Secreted protein n=1 Tax=Toxocara canis TaxID=6265 RepID=A0A183UA33_TOXCA|nr:unnamed protein product [Toxocara canis]
MGEFRTFVIGICTLTALTPYREAVRKLFRCQRSNGSRNGVSTVTDLANRVNVIDNAAVTQSKISVGTLHRTSNAES